MTAILVKLVGLGIFVLIWRRVSRFRKELNDPDSIYCQELTRKGFGAYIGLFRGSATLTLLGVALCIPLSLISIVTDLTFYFLKNG